MKPPVAVTILAVLHFMVGAGGILFAPLTLITVLAGPPEEGASPSLMQAPNMQGFSYIMLIGSYVASVLLIAAGIGLLRMRKWAWRMSIGCAAFSLAMFLMSRVVLLALSIGASGGRGQFFVLLVAGTAVLCLPSFMHPVLTLFILLPGHVRRRFDAAELCRSDARPPATLELGSHTRQDAWYYRAGRGRVVGPLRKAELDESVTSGRLGGRCEVWQPGQPSVWAMDLYPQLRSNLPAAVHWLIFGPHLPPYRPADPEGRSNGWKWAVVTAASTFGAMLLLVIGVFGRYELAAVLPMAIGSVVLFVASLGLAGVLFEWRWFFENRNARGVRWWAGDQGSRWLYVVVSAVSLLGGYGLVGYGGMRAMAGKHPFVGLMPDGTNTASTAMSEKFTGERSALAGGLGGSPFERFDRQQRPVLGFRWRLGEWDNEQVVAKIEPLFERSPLANDVVMAKEGYQVGGVLVESGEFVNAVRVIFVRTRVGELDTDDTYLSDWIGASTNAAPHQLGGDGRIVVGVFGRQGIVTDALGLLFAARGE